MDSTQELIALAEQTNQLLAQTNANLLFIIGVGSAILVCYLLYSAIKRFI